MTRDIENPANPNGEAGAPESKIEVTPEMIVAGTKVLWDSGYLWSERHPPAGLNLVVRDILRAALHVGARRSSQTS
jgi:hypothetical protein